MLFWAAVFAVLWYIRRHPQGAVARVAYSWHGPYPARGELRSAYYRRVSSFAFGWLWQFLVLAVVGYVWLKLEPSAAESSLFQLVFLFALPLGMGMALLGGVVARVTAVKAATLGPDGVFEGER